MSSPGSYDLLPLPGTNSDCDGLWLAGICSQPLEVDKDLGADLAGPVEVGGGHADTMSFLTGIGAGHPVIWILDSIGDPPYWENPVWFPPPGYEAYHGEETLATSQWKQSVLPTSGVYVWGGVGGTRNIYLQKVEHVGPGHIN